MKENCKKKLFISGPITDTPFYWRAFEEARDFYEAEGYAVINPAELPVGMSNADYTRICLSMIDSADEVAFLPGWSGSEGAALEWRYCRYTKKPKRYYGNDKETGCSQDANETTFYCHSERPDACKCSCNDDYGFSVCMSNSRECMFRYPVKPGNEAREKTEYKIKLNGIGGFDFVPEKKDKRTVDDAVSNVLDFAVGQALQDGYVIDFAFDKDGWTNVTLRPMPRLRSKEASE